MYGLAEEAEKIQFMLATDGDGFRVSGRLVSPLELTWAEENGENI